MSLILFKRSLKTSQQIFFNLVQFIFQALETNAESFFYLKAWYKSMPKDILGLIGLLFLLAITQLIENQSRQLR